MQVYLVRLRKNKELVGIFVSPTASRLWEFVDECCDPYVCEFVILPAGGLYQSQAGAPRVPTRKRYPTEERDIPNWFAGADISELWIHAFYDEGNWQPIEPED